ncbi:uncharacterized protein N7459_004314 [Penicillium hispanicum]|uniref:uncharacterized protein n=1 Tax=Penicillium hispanicum TaxID=1080232 RepID=UPI00254185F3|nr:uncharacterized protein N7459_004314 [Penicillium hispanicum]KAJ5584514.1 hypothetical protein N7459_004314 [Penicillium hispanicum]
MTSALRPGATTSFSSAQFLSDIEKISKEIDSPFDKSAVETVVTKFERYFKSSAVVLRSKDRPNDTLNYRLFMYKPSDTVEAAIESNLLEPGHPFIPLLGLWYSLCHHDQAPSFWLDFSTTRSTLDKTWLRISPLRPAKNLLQAPGIPNGMRNQFATLDRVGLNLVRFVAVDYHALTVNFYFPLPSPLSREQTDRLAALGDSHPPSEAKLQEMKQYLDPRGTLFAVTMKYPTGEIPRVAFYALDIDLTPDLKGLPQMNERGMKYLRAVKSYDDNPTTVISWSFGRDGGEYMKLEAGYSGHLQDLIREEAKDP